ncbi:NADH:flavin oxidoreductase/NADH oxidase [Azotobacter vinelandii CA]|uniref:NADH:flavin oxidoreductase/NADH oxidase n=2 Tax=Azotobacter vinelandii TaxID=354 RepID=C1DG70_AZOVD|nr:alkene reductase [Azotobacter vinelandii]ACO78381.1 NADH:flavin oxidoreductase/NADH oxidase [Azotobacter vinelandii DJ]AGK13769.1 NADH:flavin oxidoreductase/NADH oxidase [Azotobacter vinelandii CA]AGK18370.1 NADH:flavin oxidoreductase/NADH oxidase [Azotobacter vinelandii CA6]SFY20869.1 N-ethylmaleimide reductase [Azotobacter vinelandii]GLK60413.1 alkene reductase [Azotobacter vinelandii]
MSIFQSGQIGNLALANRIVMAPLGRARSDVQSRVPLPRVATYYSQRAGAGLIVSEATHVSPNSVSRPGGSAIHTAEQVEGWKAVTAAVHAAGGRIFQQLFHLGRKAHQGRLPGNALPVAPSAIAAQGEVETPQGPQPFPVPRALERAEIPALVEEFRQAARNSLLAGFDGVEIHAANGYLIDQFLRDGSNRRQDDYGGSVANRARLLLEIVDAVIGVFGPGRVGVRISPHFEVDGIGDSDPAALYTHVAEQLQARGIAYLHLIEPDSVEPARRLAPRLRQLFRGAFILAGEFDRARAIRALAEGRADFVAFGRLFIANPDLVERLRREAPLNPPDEATFYSGEEHGYIDYPFLAVG